MIVAGVTGNIFQIEVMICHYPTGASKWNPVEHRLFSFISLNWAGIPLRSLNTMLKLIRGTTTETGLKVKAALIQPAILILELLY